MNRTITYFALALVLALSLAFVGCDKPADDPATAPPAEEPAEAPAPDFGEYKLVVPGKLTIGSDLDYPPFEILNADGEPEGYDVDLITEVCKELGLEVNYLGPQAFESLPTQVAAGTKMDVAVSAFTITPERAEIVDFTDDYFVVNQVIAVMKDSDITGKADLAGKRVAVQSGSTPDLWARENLPDSEIIALPNNTDAFSAMTAGQADAVINDELTSNTFIGKTFKDAKVVEIIPTAEEYGIAVSKDNPELTKAINWALGKIKADGRLEEIHKKWIED